MRRWKGFEHGVNLGGWFSQCDHTKERHDTFINENDIKKISEWGLDHVRLPMDYELVEAEDGSYMEDGFAYIDKVLEWTERYKLNIVLDLHKTFGFSFDFGENESGFFENEDYQERFYRLWEEFARRYGNIGDRVAFELLNEVTDKELCDIWNRISTRCIERIRKIAPNVKILVGGYWNNSIESLKDLLPPYDENVVYNFHCYEPLIFTHQGAYWVPGMDRDVRISVNATYGEIAEATKDHLSMVSVPLTAFDQEAQLGTEYFDKYFAEAVRIAEERNVPLYCGEYGVINLADAQETLKWYRLIGKSFNRFGIGRAAWSYKEMDFGLTDEHLKDVLDDIVKEL